MSYNPPSFNIIQPGNFYSTLEQSDYEIKDFDPHNNRHQDPDPYGRSYLRFADAREKVFKLAGDSNTNNWRDSGEIGYFDDLRSCICTQDTLTQHHVIYHLSDPSKRLYLGTSCIKTYNIKRNCLIPGCKQIVSSNYMSPWNEMYVQSYSMCEDHRPKRCYMCLEEGEQVRFRVKQALCAPCREDVLSFEVDFGVHAGKSVREVEEEDPDFLFDIFYALKKHLQEEEIPLREHIKKHRYTFAAETFKYRKA